MSAKVKSRSHSEQVAPTEHVAPFHNTDPAKFELYLRAREMGQIRDALTQVMHLPQPQREDWLLEYGEYVAEQFNEFIDESNLTFSDVRMDDEVVALSQELVVSLREALSTVHGMLHAEAELEG